MAKKMTIFQTLNNVIGKQGVKNDYSKKSYNLNNGELLKTQSKEEFDVAKLQAQQNKYLKATWNKVDGELYQQAIHYETTRVGSYSDFETMEFYPEISAALDIMMEESTTPNDKGNIINVYSSSTRVKAILEDLFVNRLDIHTSLPMWTRNVPIREDSIIPLLDGTEVTIKKLSEMVKNGEEVWSYAIQDVTKDIVPSKIVWCDLTRENSELYRVTLDNGTHIDTTPDHPYKLRNGLYKRADELTVGQSLMPFYTKISENERISGYEKVYNPNSNHYKFTHGLVGREISRDLEYENNVDENLNPNILNDSIYIRAKKISNSKSSNEIKALRELNNPKSELNNPKNVILNHKVLSVEKLSETSDVYCLEAVGPNGEHDRHNFPVCSQNVNGQHDRDGVFLSNCKYGDNFVQLNIDDKAGIVGARQLPNFEIERRENNIHGIISPAQLMGVNADDAQNKTQFFWKGRDITFKSWQIAHFRLLGDDRKLPYGTSFLEKARRIWKQLILSEDAMLVYRVTRAPERRVYKIFVGNIDNEDVEQYVNEIANRFKRSPLIDPQTGQMDLRYNQMGYDQDIFVPVRREDAATPIDTLPGAQNLDQIADIEYLQKKLFTALRVPKTFLGFEEPSGEGKNLALQDIRFSRTINRIQQAMLHELNKIAIVHLYILGFVEDLDNFTLTLNNPSTQAEMLKIEQTREKVGLYKDCVADAGNGFGVMSMTRAKKEILGWSEDEIKQDILEQRMEKAAAAELENTMQVIKHTGFYDKVDRVYGDMEIALKGGQVPEEGEGGGGSGGGAGGGSFGGGGGFGGEPELDLGGDDEEAGGGGADAGGDASPFGDEEIETEEPAGGEETTAESKVNSNKKMITEKRYDYFNALSEGLVKEADKIPVKIKIYDKNIKINDRLNMMIEEIDKKLKT